MTKRVPFNIGLVTHLIYCDEVLIKPPLLCENGSYNRHKEHQPYTIYRVMDATLTLAG